MRGVGGKPYLDLDPFLPIAELEAMHQAICFGLAQASYRDGVYGSRNLLRDDVHCVSELGKELRRRPDDPRARDLARLPDLKSKLRFLKLISGSQSLGQSVVVRASRAYSDKHKSDACAYTDNRRFFPELIAFAEALPFRELGRIVLFVSDCNSVGHIHRDHPEPREGLEEFIWMVTRRDKKFFVYDEDTDTRHYIRSHAAFFNNNDYHGYDPVPKMTFSIRVDGVFDDRLRAQLGLAS